MNAHLAKSFNRITNKITTRLAYHGINITPNDRRLAGLEGKYRGQKAVIIGTGPSLRIEDLDRLAGWTTFACNKIYLAFDRTPWRPDFYSICDIKLAEHCNEFDFGKEFTGTTIINSCITSEVFRFALPVNHYRYSEEDSISFWRPGEKPHPPESFSKGILSGGNSVMIDQLQMAYLMGFSEVAIIGADLSYFGGTKTGGKSLSGELIRYQSNEAEKNYFHKDYYQPGAVTTVPNVDEMKVAWEFCRLLFESTGKSLINASRQTALEHVPRGDFDAMFPR
jgi:hypothetical protein